MSKYYVAINYCSCHPETCCCDDWAVYAPEDTVWATFFNKEKAEEIAALLNDKLNKN